MTAVQQGQRGSTSLRPLEPTPSVRGLIGIGVVVRSCRGSEPCNQYVRAWVALAINPLLQALVAWTNPCQSGPAHGRWPAISPGIRGDAFREMLHTNSPGSIHVHPDPSARRWIIREGFARKIRKKPARALAPQGTPASPGDPHEKGQFIPHGLNQSFTLSTRGRLCSQIFTRCARFGASGRSPRR